MTRKTILGTVILATGLTLALLAMGERVTATGAQLPPAQSPIRTSSSVANPPAELPGQVVGSGFTHQGFLEQDGAPVDGSCDFTFALFDAGTAGNQIGTTETESNVTVSQGRFTVQLNEVEQFGGDAFAGGERWLEVAVRCSAGSGSYSTLSPRQALTASPYALSLQPGATISGTTDGSIGILNLTNSFGTGLQVDAANRNGVQVTSAGTNGVNVFQAGLSGMSVGTAGNPSTTNESFFSNGFDVDGAEGNGLYVGQADRYGVDVHSAGFDGVHVGTAGRDGVYVGSAGNDGVHVEFAGIDGMQVIYAGTPSSAVSSLESDGFEIAGAEGNGLFVGRADIHGVHVESAGIDGMSVNLAGDDGVDVNGAEDNGIGVSGAANLAGYFIGDVTITGVCTGCTQAVFGVNGSEGSLAPGTIVSLQAARAPAEALAGAPILLEVGPAVAGEAIVGVVAGRAELDSGDEEQDGSEQPHLVPREGAAAPGEYVTIIIYGLAQVQASALEASIAAGDRLAVNEAGMARQLQTRMLDGMMITEGAPTVGTAVEGLEAGEEGLIWVLVGK